MSKRALACGLGAAIILGTATPAAACIWDRDTIMQERSRFPTALELMTGKFIHHTPSIYAWRIRDREAKIASFPDDLSLVDDLAVAHDKLGDHGAAIAAMEAILPRDPQRYETLANLGTFYLHSGDLERGVEFIDRALEVNASAHFGRERYQRWLAEYLLAKRGEGAELSLPLFTQAPHGFEAFLAEKRGVERLSTVEVRAAVTGVLGMMRFGKHDSPILLEVLGDLLSAPHDAEDAKRLAARAYLLAGEGADDPAARSRYEARAEALLLGKEPRRGAPVDTTLGEVKAALVKERAEADAWYQDLAAREDEWARSAADPEERLRELYARDPVSTGEIKRAARVKPRKPRLARREVPTADADGLGGLGWTLLAGFVGVVVGVFVLIIRYADARSSRSA